MIPFFPMLVVQPPPSARGPGNRHALEVAEGEGMVDRRDTDFLDEAEDWWRGHHAESPWAATGNYSDFASAYQAGTEGFFLYGLDGQTFEESSVSLRRDYELAEFWLRWDEVREACRAAWDHAEKCHAAPDFRHLPFSLT